MDGPETHPAGSRQQRQPIAPARAPVLVAFCGIAFGLAWPAVMKALHGAFSFGLWGYALLLLSPALVLLGVAGIPSRTGGRRRLAYAFLFSLAVGGASAGIGLIAAELFGALRQV